MKVINTLKTSKIRLIKKSFTGELYDSSIYLSKIPLICRSWISDEKIGEFGLLLDKLEEYLTLEQLRLVYKNLVNLKLKKLSFFDSVRLNGYYDVMKREFSYKNGCAKAHEFLHLASSFYDFKSDVSYSGISQWDSSGSIGIGLNEGYTEVLNERLFYETFYKDSYVEEVYIARMLELFFDDDREMMGFYFGCDLPGFIRYFEKFTSRDEIIKLLIEIDRFSSLSIYDLPFCKGQLVKIYDKIYSLFLSTDPDVSKIKMMEDIILSNESVGSLFEVKGKKLVRKK